ncbi:Ulp1 protease family C-terminal catalytic domain [Arabidopsis suecica]|uniref:Ulp1 protease family C-terminal catalytic domain n=1 Tax=Arabidopsis suecica TaxID=45249 RepID=A0A8T1ZDW0_ARASU|nr:Ulp1 protease family C-terminal catalytic domain [Arabidopsis suecica]
MDLHFQLIWKIEYERWLKDKKKLPFKTSDYFSGLMPKYAETEKTWGKDVDTVYAVVPVTGDHWVAIAIDFKDRVVRIYNCGTTTDFTISAVKPFAEITPYVFKSLCGDSNIKAYEIEDVPGTPKMTHPGDCGVYTAKYIECLMMGVPLSHEHLRDENMGKIRQKLAAEMSASIKSYGVTADIIDVDTQIELTAR